MLPQSTEKKIKNVKHRHRVQATSQPRKLSKGPHDVPGKTVCHGPESTTEKRTGDQVRKKQVKVETRKLREERAWFHCQAIPHIYHVLGRLLPHPHQGLAN